MSVDGLAQPVSVDCAFGGMWYAIVDADGLGLQIEPSQGGKIAKLGEKIKVKLRLRLRFPSEDSQKYYCPYHANRKRIGDLIVYK